MTTKNDLMKEKKEELVDLYLDLKQAHNDIRSDLRKQIDINSNLKKEIEGFKIENQNNLDKNKELRAAINMAIQFYYDESADHLNQPREMQVFNHLLRIIGHIEPSLSDQLWNNINDAKTGINRY
jgi:cobyrinic acid a,c-diamide synthase